MEGRADNNQSKEPFSIYRTRDEAMDETLQSFSHEESLVSSHEESDILIE